MREAEENTRQYRPIPFWSWNDKLEAGRLLEQAEWMAGESLGGYFMHARSGLTTEYLSEEWMKCIEACALQANRNNMKAWIYDENGWPSGFAGGKLLENDENRDKYIVAKEGAYDSDATVSYVISEEQLERVYEQVGEEYTCLNLYIHTATSTADILNPNVVGPFIELTHQTYKDYFGNDFSEKIEGFFTDEPQYYRWDTPYTDMVAKYWNQHYGKDILDELGLLFVEKDGYRSFRYRYWKAMQQLMLLGFAKQVYSWCDDNGVKLTGHYIEETSLGFQMMCCGGVMPFYEYMHIPGIDWLGKDTENELSPKQVASVAAQLGKKRIITETFAGCGWDVLPSELQRIVGFQYVNGVNMMCHHLIPYSERGTRKYDYPAHFSTVNPWVEHGFEKFNDYYTKLGYLLGEGEKHVNVAMLHPIRSAYFDYKRNEDGFGVEALDASLKKACRLLSSHGIEYHFLDETLLAKHGYIRENSIGCGKCEYDVLVLPKLITMDIFTEKLIRQYVQQGGKVLMLDEKPTYVEAEPYDYNYLVTNISLDEIADMQPYRVKYYDTHIYSTLRTLKEKQYLYVVNSSATDCETQVYNFGSGINSLAKINLQDMSKNLVPLEVTLKPGEDALFIPCSQMLEAQEESIYYSLRFERAVVSVKENYFPIDYVSYSIDGNSYSQPWPCMALFKKLVKEQYSGKIYFRYEFEVNTIPNQISLRVEKSREQGVWLNGKAFDTSSAAENLEARVYDITHHVVKGKNTFTTLIDWYEDDLVHYALFGENVTESLRNCLVYDTELQPIELIGEFGVYSHQDYFKCEENEFVQGKDFYIGRLPEYVSEPSMEGFPFFAGEMTLSQKIYLDSTRVMLQVLGEYQMAYVKVNNVSVGTLLFDKLVDISSVAKIGENDIEIRFVMGNRNRMGPHHFSGDKNGMADPWKFDMFDYWDGEKCMLYHEEYDIKKFYI